MPLARTTVASTIGQLELDQHEPRQQAGRLPPHAVPLCQLPVASQIRGVSSLHCVAPGEHSTHAPSRHAGVTPAHGDAVPHWPLVHVCTALLEHCFVPVAQTQAPFMHTGVLPEHASALPQFPFESHVSTASPEHRVSPGVHAAHAPFTHAGVLPAQATAVPHCPLAVQDSTPLPVHRVCLGEHTPVQAPAMHVRSVQGVPASHCPDALQVATSLPEHPIVPGVQTLHLSPTQYGMFPVHVIGLLHCPMALHTSSALPMHRVVVGAHSTHLPA